MAKERGTVESTPPPETHWRKYRVTAWLDAICLRVNNSAMHFAGGPLTQFPGALNPVRFRS